MSNPKYVCSVAEKRYAVCAGCPFKKPHICKLHKHGVWETCNADGKRMNVRCVRVKPKGKK